MLSYLPDIPISIQILWCYSVIDNRRIIRIHLHMSSQVLFTKTNGVQYFETVEIDFKTICSVYSYVIKSEKIIECYIKKIKTIFRLSSNVI